MLKPTIIQSPGESGGRGGGVGGVGGVAGGNGGCGGAGGGALPQVTATRSIAASPVKSSPRTYSNRSEVVWTEALAGLQALP